MKASEYLKKCIKICEIFDVEHSRCSECPLEEYGCGLPGSEEKVAKSIKTVKEFELPPGPHVCPSCQNTEHPEGAKFCMICGMEILRESEGRA